MKILIVDDDATNRELLRAVLETEGYTVCEAGDGREALELLEREEVGAIITDILMPNVDGYRLCYEVRRSKRFCDLPVIFYTSTYTSPSDEKLSHGMGADQFIRKPASAAILRKALDEALNARGRRPAATERPGGLAVMEEYTARLVAKLEEKNRKLAEKVQELQSTRDDLEHLLAHTPAVIYRLTIEGVRVRPTLISENISSLLGYGVAETMSHSFWQESLHPADRERMLGLVAQLQRGEAFSAQYRLRHKDGTYRWVEDSNRVLLDDAGQPKECVGVLTDITQRKTVEVVLRSTESELLEARRLAKCGNWSWDIPADRVTWSDELYAIFGEEKGKFTQSHAWFLQRVDPADREAVLQANRKGRVEGKPFEVVYGISTRAGEKRVVRELGYAIRDDAGNIVRLVGTAQDITAQKQVEVDLRWKTAFLEAQVNSSLDGILVLDNEGKKLLQNQRLSEMWKLPAEVAAEADDERQLQFMIRRTRDPRKFIEIVTYLKTHPDEIGHDEIELVDGTVLDRSSSPVVGEDGTWYGRIWVFRDVTDRKQLELQLRQAQKMEAFGQLAGGVAHDFGNMLAVIRGNVELALMNPGQLTPETREGLGHVVSATENATNLTRQLLTFSRIQVMQPRASALNDLVKNLTKMLRRVIREDIRLQCTYAEQLPLVQADAGMIEHALLNLVVNARDAMPQGGELTISTAEVSLSDADAKENCEARAGEFVRLQVRDTGTGIASEHLPRIFEPFFTTKERGKGTGLGLSSVFGIVKQHLGWVEVSSEVGKGTVFSIFLPSVPPNEHVAPAPEAAAELRGGDETVLLVEDEFAVRTITRRVLETFNYKVYEATCAREALGIWSEHGTEIALMLTDIVMPEGVTGRDLAEELRAQRPGLKVIFMSGYSAEVIDKETTFFRRAKIRLLQKPCSADVLIRTIRQCLDEPPPDQDRSHSRAYVVEAPDSPPPTQSCSSEAMTDLNNLIEALRAELQQCGAMLACLDDLEAQQTPGGGQEARFQVQALQEQEKIVEQALHRREKARRHVARHLHLPEEASLTEIIPFLSRHHQLLVGALMEENRQLCARCQQGVQLRKKALL